MPEQPERTPERIPTGSINIQSWLDEDGQHRWHLETGKDDGATATHILGLLVLGIYSVLKRAFGEEA